MPKRTATPFLAVTFLALLPCAPAWAGPGLSLYPNNDLSPSLPLSIQGNQSVSGFGFDLLNDNGGYLLIEGVSVLPDPSALGAWTDLFTPTLTAAIAPLAEITQTWIQGTQGLGEFSFAYAAAGYAGPTFTIELQYALYDADPLDPVNGSSANLLADAQTLDTSVQFNVTDPAVTLTPEPASLWLLLAGSASLGVLAKPWKKSRARGVTS